MKIKHQLRRGFTLVELLVVIAIIATLAGVGVPVIISKQKEGFRTEAVANAKSIGIAMFSFEQDYGSYPTTGTDGTSKQVEENNPEAGFSYVGKYSNDYFRQLIGAGYVDSEQTFYAKGAYTKKPDSVMRGEKCLGAGEVGFAYIMQTDGNAIPSSGNSRRPLVVGSVFNGLTNGTFDPDVYARNGVVLRLDQSASIGSIRPSDKKMIVGGGKTLLQTGPDTVWGNDLNPEIKAPQKTAGSNAGTPTTLQNNNADN